jgi:anti-sigma factor RsiW
MSACAAWASELDDVALGTPMSNALATHVATCPACAAHVAQQRALVQRIDRAIVGYVGAQPTPGLPERIRSRVAMRPARRWNSNWLGIPAAMSVAAAVFAVITALSGQHAAVHASAIAALDAWRSPTASLLMSRSSVLAAPFSLQRVPNDTVRPSTITQRRSST